MVVWEAERELLLWAGGGILFIIAFRVSMNYRVFRRYRESLQARGILVLSHNMNYSEFDIDSEGKRIGVTLDPGGRHTPGFVSFTFGLENEEQRTFSLIPRRWHHATPDDNLVLDKKFEVSDNLVSAATIEHLLSPVREDLIACLINGSPSVTVSSQTLVTKFAGGGSGYDPDKTLWGRYLRITTGLIDSLKGKSAGSW
jgi:hypothetical protein